jgi:indoleamine 2,3-dioxygenase
MSRSPCLIEQEDRYDDGIFRIGRKHGFLPQRSPLVRLPPPFDPIQRLLDEMPVWLDVGSGRQGVLGTPGLIAERVAQLPNLVDDVTRIVADAQDKSKDHRDASRLVQALFRGYGFLTSAYLLESAHHGTRAGGAYGKARNVLPSALAQPLVLTADALGIPPWLDYHHSYSLGNFVHRDSTLHGEDLWHWKNLDMACRFSGTSDETGFIMLHVQINQHTAALLGAFQDVLRDAQLKGGSENPAGPWQRLLRALEHINRSRREMWRASRPERYNDFRVFIMGITGNEALFGPGVVYQGVKKFGEKPMQFRGQTGAQDDIVPACDILLGIDNTYPTNELTDYLRDLRQYRPPVVQKWFDDVRKDRDAVELDQFLASNPGIALIAAACVEQITLFRIGHWQFVQKYILAHTRHATATGGTPITSWLPNQIDACFARMDQLLGYADPHKLSESERRWHGNMSQRLNERRRILTEQRALLENPAFDPREIYARNIGHEDAAITG